MIVGLGLDILEIARVRRLLDNNGSRLIARLFTDEEAAYALARPDHARHFAARLAAKEAAYKALAGNDLARTIGWRDIEVRNGADGSPALALHGRAHVRAAEMRVDRILVSLTHSEASAVAVVILEGATQGVPS